MLSLILVWSELARWWRGSEEHTFAVEKGVGHAMQINLDLVIRMHCVDVDVNVQDAAGDRILAGQMLRREQTMWAHWVDAKGMHKLRARSPDGKVVTGAGWQTLDTAQAVYGYGTPDNHGIERNDWYDEEGFGEEHVHDIVAAGRKKAKWGKTPRLNGQGDSCRIFGSLELNKVQGDFHITARGHGYMDVGHEHLDHSGEFSQPSWLMAGTLGPERVGAPSAC